MDITPSMFAVTTSRTYVEMGCIDSVIVAPVLTFATKVAFNGGSAAFSCALVIEGTV